MSKAPHCPDPSALTILGDYETEHVVQLTETGFTIQHPLRERLDDKLMPCDLHENIGADADPPRSPGRYRASWSVEWDCWAWEPLS